MFEKYLGYDCVFDVFHVWILAVASQHAGGLSNVNSSDIPILYVSKLTRAFIYTAILPDSAHGFDKEYRNLNDFPFAFSQHMFDIWVELLMCVGVFF